MRARDNQSSCPTQARRNTRVGLKAERVRIRQWIKQLVTRIRVRSRPVTSSEWSTVRHAASSQSSSHARSPSSRRQRKIGILVALNDRSGGNTSRGAPSVRLCSISGAPPQAMTAVPRAITPAIQATRKRVASAGMADGRWTVKTARDGMWAETHGIGDRARASRSPRRQPRNLFSRCQPIAWRFGRHAGSSGTTSFAPCKP